MSEEANAGDEVESFEQLGLDERLLQAIAFLNWTVPTPVQAASIPLAMQGKDLLVGATTGSGKTAIFLIPVIQHLLDAHRTADPAKTAKKSKSTTCLIVTPTKELAFQTRDVVNKLCRYCSKEVYPFALDPMEHDATKATLLASKTPDILIGTPSQVLKVTEYHTPKIISKVKYFIIDEADVMFSFGYENDLKKILQMTCKTFQSIVVSATLSKEIAIMKTLLPRNPTLVRVANEELPDQSQLTQLKMDASDSTSKFLILLALIKFNILRGKTLIFCNSVKQAYKLKLFLVSFEVQTVVLNHNLPLNSRTHVVNQFNEGRYRTVIVTDDAVMPLEEQKSGKKKGNQKNPSDQEYTLSRGIDFQEVSVVINFDFPLDTLVYVHRAGRTARGVKKGTVLSLVLPPEQAALEACQERQRIEGMEEEECPIVDFTIDMKEIEKLRYRANDVLSNISDRRIKDCKRQELEEEILRSKKLRNHFKTHPLDLSAIRHDKANKLDKQLKLQFGEIAHIPSYLLPPDAVRNQRDNRNKRTHQPDPNPPGSGKVRKKNPLKF